MRFLVCVKWYLTKYPLCGVAVRSKCINMHTDTAPISIQPTPWTQAQLQGCATLHDRQTSFCSVIKLTPEFVFSSGLVAWLSRKLTANDIQTLHRQTEWASAQITMLSRCVSLVTCNMVGGSKVCALMAVTGVELPGLTLTPFYLAVNVKELHHPFLLTCYWPQRRHALNWMALIKHLLDSRPVCWVHTCRTLISKSNYPLGACFPVSLVAPCTDFLIIPSWAHEFHLSLPLSTCIKGFKALQVL